MKKLFLLFATLVVALSLPSVSIAQQGVGLGVSAQVSVGRQPHLGQGLGLTNVWVVNARHCDAYAHKMRITGENGSVTFNYLTQSDADACNADDSTIYATRKNHNLVTNAGYDVAASALSNTATQAAACNYIAFAIDSSNTGAGTVAITDTTLASSGTGSTELAVNGLSRAQATYAHSNGTLTYTLTKAFSVTGTSTGVNKLGVFNAASTGSLCYELLFTPVTVNNLDTLTPTLTVTMSNP